MIPDPITHPDKYSGRLAWLDRHQWSERWEVPHCMLQLMERKFT